MAKKSLGRGLEALIPKNLDSSLLEEDKHRVQKLLIGNIVSNPSQPRREFDKIALGELTKSVQQYGVLQPIIVVRVGRSGSYQVVAGERRWRAAKDAKLTHVPAIVRSYKELEQIEIALIENIQRVDLSPLEQALSVYKLQQQFNLSLEQIGQKLGKAVSTLSNLTRLLQLPDAARQALAGGQISEGHARTILSLKNQPAKQQELLSCILNNGWTVRQAEQFAGLAKKGSSLDQANSSSAKDNDITKDLTQYFDTNVKIRRSGRHGQLIIIFNSDKKLDEIIKKLHEQR